MPRVLLVLTLLLGSLPWTTGCVRTRTEVVRVPYPVEVRHPPCLGAAERPPVPPPDTTPADPAWADYYARLLAWTWSTWRRCRPPETESATPVGDLLRGGVR